MLSTIKLLVWYALWETTTVGSTDSYTLNFSRPAQGIYVQFYKFLRLGTEGYQMQLDNQMAVAQYICQGLLNMAYKGKERFEIIDAIKSSKTLIVENICLPVATTSFAKVSTLPLVHQVVPMT